MSDNRYISIKGAKANNLKNEIDAFRNRFVVILDHRIWTSFHWHSIPCMLKGCIVREKVFPHMLSSS